MKNKFLFDTHAFLWLRNAPHKVSKLALQIYQNSENLPYLSMASIWEMQIKYQLGKLKFELPLAEMIDEQCQLNDLRILPIEQRHIFELSDLPLYHKDPFDRLLIAQSRIDKIPIISADNMFEQYEVEVIW